MTEAEKEVFKDKLRNNKIWFCPLPFTHIFSSLSGRYAPCYDADCHTGHNVKDTSIKEWYTSDFLNKLRTEMLKEDGDLNYISNQCTGCWKQEQKYGKSDRMRYCNDLVDETYDRGGKKLERIFDAIGRFDKEGKAELKDRVLDIKMKIFGNLCNLDCYMCTPRSASTRTASLKKLKRVYDPNLDPSDKIRMNTERLDAEAVLDDIASVAQYTRSIKLIGGEPLVMKNHYKLLEKLVATGHSGGIAMIYKTNLSVFNMENYNFMDYVGHFKEFVMKTSIDSYGIYNDYIRKRSNWGQLLENIKAMQERKNVRLNVHSVVSSISILSFYKLQEFLKEAGIDHTYYILEHPAILNVKNLPKEIKESLIPKYEGYPNLQRALKKEWDPKAFVNAIEYCHDLDQQHGHKLYDLHPELEPHYQALMSQQSESDANHIR